MLATIPLMLVLLIPEDIMHTDRRLEMALIVYLFGLMSVMKFFPKIAEKYIGIASFTRKWLISMTKLSWLAPVLVLWLLGRVASVAVIGWMGPDLNLSINLEKELFESSLSIGAIPETSFLDLLTALAVMPLAAFTTMAVLGAGSSDPPEWMYDFQKPVQVAQQELSEPGLVRKGAGMAVSVAASAAIGAGTVLASKTTSVVQGAGAMVSGAPVAGQAPAIADSVSDRLSTLDKVTPVDDFPSLESQNMDFQGISDLFDQEEVAERLLESKESSGTPPAFNEPVISGLRKSK